MVTKTEDRASVSCGELGHSTPSVGICDQLPQSWPWAEWKSLAVEQTAEAGLEEISEAIGQCGHAYKVSRCADCGAYPATPYHCDQRLCPTCYYRLLLRFFRRHRERFEGLADITRVSVDWGAWKEDTLAEGLRECQVRHRELLKAVWQVAGGVYHIEVKYHSEGECFSILYHYLLDCHPNTALYIMLAVVGVGQVRGYKGFKGYQEAYGHFLRRCCDYPASVVAHPHALWEYLGAVRHQKLVQGFGSLYRVSGGRGKEKREKVSPVCPLCGGGLRSVGMVDGGAVSWDREHRCYVWRPPGVPLRG